MASSIQLHTIVFARLHWIYLLYCCGDISYQEILLCVVSHSLQIYISYSKNCWVFHPPCLEGFPKVYLVSYGWLFYVVDLFMRFIYCWYKIFIGGWYKYYYVADIKFHKCWNCLIKVLKFKHLRFFWNINMILYWDFRRRKKQKNLYLW